VNLPALLIQSRFSGYYFGVASHSIHQMDTVFLTQLHYIITLKAESYYKALILRFQIKSICTSNQIRPSEICHGPRIKILRMNTKPHGLFITCQEVYDFLFGVAVEVMVFFWWH
jgi:hypothetical protein